MTIGTVRRAVAAASTVALSSLLLPTLAAATPQAAPRAALESTSVFASTNVVSSTGKKLKLTVSATKPAGRAASMRVAVGTRSGNESHTFSFPKATMDIAATGAGTVKLSGTQAGGKGVMNLRVSTDGTMRTTRCGGQVASKTRNVVVKGIAFFDTGSTWGKIGSRTRATRFAQMHSVSWSYDVACPLVDPGLPRCQASLSWNGSTYNATTGASTSLGGYQVGTTANVFGSRTVKLPRPSGAYRTDQVSRTGVKAPTLAVSGTTATMKAFGPIGSATLKDPDGGWTTGAQECKRGTGTGTQTDTWWSGSWTNAGTALKVPAAVYGSLSLPNGEHASFSRRTVSAG